MTTGVLPPRRAAVSTRRQYLWVTELFKCITVRRNAAALFLGACTALVIPWLFLAAFGWLATEGIASTPLEVIALSNRNQTPAFLLMIVLGLQAYLSDASNGVLLSELAESQRDWRRGPAMAKLLFGVVGSLTLAGAITFSNAVSWWILGVGALTPTQQAGLMPFWFVSFGALFAAMTANYLFGLLTAAVLRTKGLAAVVAIALPWIVGTILMATLRSALPAAAEIAAWVLPSELTNTMSSWVPGGNTILAATTEHLALRALAVLAWLAAGASTWILLMQRRALYPADQG